MSVQAESLTQTLERLVAASCFGDDADANLAGVEHGDVDGRKQTIGFSEPGVQSCLLLDVF
jgi:hypothetical protein